MVWVVTTMLIKFYTQPFRHLADPDRKNKNLHFKISVDSKTEVLPTSWPFSETFCWDISVSSRLPPIRSPTRRIPRTPCHKRGIAGRRRGGWMTKQRCPYQRLRSTSQASMLTIAELLAVIWFTFDAFNTSTYSGRTLSLTECSDHLTVDIIQSAQILVLITVV